MASRAALFSISARSKRFCRDVSSLYVLSSTLTSRTRLLTLSSSDCSLLKIEWPRDSFSNLQCPRYKHKLWSGRLGAGYRVLGVGDETRRDKRNTSVHRSRVGVDSEHLSYPGDFGLGQTGENCSSAVGRHG